MGVVAQKPWQAVQIANKLKVQLPDGDGSGLPSHANFYDYLRTQEARRADTMDMWNAGDEDQKLLQSGECSEGHLLLSTVPDASSTGSSLRGRRCAER